MNLNFNFTGKTTLKDWWKIVKENFTTIKSNFESHQNAAELNHPDKSVKQRHIADKAVGQAQIADYSIGQTQLAQYSVSSAKIYPEAVQTPHIKDGNVTKAKLETSIQTQLDNFQSHIENPSQEIADSAVTTAKLADYSVTWNKIEDSTTQALIRNFYMDTDTYNLSMNNFNKALSRALFFSFNSKHGAFSNAPSDTTTYKDGYIHYIVLVVPVNLDDRFQIAFNLGSGRKFYRTVSGSSGGTWTEM